MVGSSTQGKTTPDTDGAFYDSFTVGTANDPEEVLPINENTNSVAVKAPSANGDVVYIGWDDDVSTSNGFPLEAGTGISFDLDAFQQVLYAVSNTAGTELRFIATR